MNKALFDPVLTKKFQVKQNNYDNATISCIIPIILTTTGASRQRDE